MHTTFVKGSTWSALLRRAFAALLLAGSAASLAGTLPATTGTLAGTTRSFSLWAKAGTTTLPGGATATVWGYTDDAGATPAAPGGPMLIANEGESVTVVLSNMLSQPTGLHFQGQALVPDTAGAAPGGTKTYTFTASSPGTFLYEAGANPTATHQVAMGLYGALIVRPAAAPLSQAYADAATAYTDEALLVLGEIDPALTNRADPSTFDMRDYAPRYFLINGKAYPATDPIASAPGNRVLLRYVNAGVQHHSMAVLGLRQNVVAKDAGLLPTLSLLVVAETLAPGQTADAIATVPPAAITSSRFAVYDGNLMLHNNGQPGFGGMLTFVTGGTGTADSGPVASGVSATPSPTNGSVPVTLSATLAVPPGSTWVVDAAEYFVDAPGAAGTGTPMTGAFGASSVAASATLPASLLATLAAGKHTLFVHGRQNDPAAKWGVFGSVVLNLDKAGPVTSGLTLTPNPSSGSVNVALHATGNETTTGGSTVVAAEYFVGAAGANGTGIAMSVGAPATIVSLDAILTAPVSPGTLYVHSRDALGNWGAFATIVLNVSAVGPVTSGVGAAPNPNNGTLGVNSSSPVLRVSATITSAVVAIGAAEGFIDTVGATGTGFAFVPADGTFNTMTENVFADIPLVTIAALAPGNHTIHVRGRDVLGNWGATATTVLVIDKAAPATSAVTLSPPASNASAVAVSATASDAATGNSNIAAGEYFIDAAGAAGTGLAMTVAAASPSTTLDAAIPAATIAALATGNHTVFVRARDAAGNWGATASAALLIDRTVPTFTGITIAPTTIIAGTATVDLALVGATDPLAGGLASGVAGGEYWFGATNIPAGTGTPFTGTTGLAIATNALAAGSYTVRVRIRDVAGNWSTVVRTATLVVVTEAIFADGFESNTLPGSWTSRSTANVTRLTVSTAAALAGTYGLQAQGNNTNYVQYNFGGAANPAWPTYDARFHFRPNGNVSAAGTDILVAASGTAFSAAQTLFRVRYRTNGGAPEVQVQVGTTNANAAWASLNGSTVSNAIEVTWQSGGSLQLYVNGVLAQTLAAGTGSVTAVRMGSVTTTAAATPALNFDAFVSKRTISALIGP